MPHDSLTHYLTDPEHVSEMIQCLYERVSALERQIARIRLDQSKREASIGSGGDRGV